MLRSLIRKSLFLRKLVGYNIASSGLFDNYFKNYPLSKGLQQRLNDILSSEDNIFIPRVANAGELIKGKQIMHNGLKIYVGSYYGPEYTVVLSKNKGVHEPQEERVFNEVLNSMPIGATMLEMGAFWSFYSMWFNSKVEGAKNYMVEPDEFNLGQGKRNFRLNKMKGEFIKAFIDKESSIDNGVVTLSVDEIIEKNNIPFLDMLHSDIQGFEYNMLQGAIKSIADNRIGYVFISTHSNEVHYQCEDFLKQHNFLILSSADLSQSYSEDGLIVAVAKTYKNIIQPISISRKNNV
jgi:hypothetical protein